jgi:hypothetical protein
MYCEGQEDFSSFDFIEWEEASFSCKLLDMNEDIVAVNLAILANLCDALYLGAAAASC